ncbi:hypothetical protein [Neobacillus vireti]|uniref:hypothetical protein n=1 Tax=Neobacillus vireti TaxID=220686 RepID=UPI002FFD5EA1
MYQSIAWYATLFLVFLLALAFAFVYGESRQLREYGKEIKPVELRIKALLYL